MHVEELFKNIYRISVGLPNSPLKELNSYLIRDKERSLLIDTGFRIKACRDELVAGIEFLGEKPDAVDIFLTHMHADHSGLAAEISGPGSQIYLSKDDSVLLNGFLNARINWFGSAERDILAGMPNEIIENMATINPALMFAPVIHANFQIANDGDIIQVGGYAFRCVLTPGHTPGHMCLWEEHNRIMFTGDHVLFDITPNITAWPSVEDSLGSYLNSLSIIRNYPVSTALPGHRKSGNFHSRVEELLKHHENRLDDVTHIVKTAPGLSAYEVAGRMRWKIRASSWDEFPAAQKIFAVGECMSHLDYLRLRGLVRREIDGAVFRYYLS